MSLLYDERQVIADLNEVSRSILICTECGTVSEAFDARFAPHAWDSWTVGPNAKCPHCNGTAKTIKVTA